MSEGDDAASAAAVMADPVAGGVDLGSGRWARSGPAACTANSDAFANVVVDARHFGDDVVDHYTHFACTEQAAFDAAVTDLERTRYFERI